MREEKGAPGEGEKGAPRVREGKGAQPSALRAGGSGSSGGDCGICGTQALVRAEGALKGGFVWLRLVKCVLTWQAELTGLELVNTQGRASCSLTLGGF